MLVKRRLGRHSVGVVLGIHALAKPTIASLAITAILVHVVCIVRAPIVRVVVWVVACLSMGLVHMLTLLRSRSSWVLSAQCGIGGIVPTVWSIIVPALRLLSFVRGMSRKLVILFFVDPLPNFSSVELLEARLVQSPRRSSRLRGQFLGP